MAFIKRQQNHRVPDTYRNNDYINGIKCFKMKSKHKTSRKHRNRRKKKD